MSETASLRERSIRRVLAAGLAFFALTHLAGLLAMATVLAPGMDPSAGSVATRMTYVAEHARAWRLGWLPWQLSAASDVWVSIGLVVWARARGDVRATRIAIAGCVLDAIAVVPEQWSEATLVGSFVGIDDVASFRDAWALHAGVTGVWANGFYTVMTVCWLVVARRLLGRGVLPVVVEVAMLVAFVVAGVLTYLACVAPSDEETRRWFGASTLVNGLAFPTLVAASIALGVRLLREPPPGEGIAT